MYQPRIAAPIAVKMRHVGLKSRRIWQKAPRFCISTLRPQIIKVRHNFHKSVARKSGAQILQIVPYVMLIKKGREGGKEGRREGGRKEGLLSY